MSVVVQDNFLDKKYFKELQTEILGISFPWYVSGIGPTYHPKYGRTAPSSYQMVHSVYAYPEHTPVSALYEKLVPLFDALNLLVPLRIKINLLKQEAKITEGGMHIDVPNAPENALTSILYMNTNNGYTKFETGEKVESVANRLATFPNNIEHTGTTNNCDAIYRCVMNIDWIKKLNNGEIK